MIFGDDHEKWKKTLEDGIDTVEAVVEGRDSFRVRDDDLAERMRTALAWYDGMLERLAHAHVVDVNVELAAQGQALADLMERVESLENSVVGLRGSQWTHDYQLRSAVENMIGILKNVRPFEPWRPKDAPQETAPLS